MNNSQVRDFKNGSAHWLRYWPIMAFLFIHAAGAIAMATNIKAQVSNLEKNLVKVESEQQSRRGSVYSIPRLQSDLTEIKGDLKDFKKEQRSVNNEILTYLRSNP